MKSLKTLLLRLLSDLQWILLKVGHIITHAGGFDSCMQRVGQRSFEVIRGQIVKSLKMLLLQELLSDPNESVKIISGVMGAKVVLYVNIN